ncbi:hypothetical protein PJP12_29830, partial [Mycobacterium kansasii]
DWAKGGKDNRMGKAGGKSSGARELVVKVSIAEVELKIEEGQYSLQLIIHRFHFLLLFFFLPFKKVFRFFTF